MTLPASGTLYLAADLSNSIANEMYGSGNTKTNISLADMSSEAQKSSPHGMQEFYSFNGLVTFDVVNSVGVSGFSATEITASNILHRTGESMTISTVANATRTGPPTSASPSGSVWCSVAVKNAGPMNNNCQTYILGTTTTGGSGQTATNSGTGEWQWYYSAIVVEMWGAIVNSGTNPNSFTGYVELQINAGNNLNATIDTNSFTHSESYTP